MAQVPQYIPTFIQSKTWGTQVQKYPFPGRNDLGNIRVDDCSVVDGGHSSVHRHNNSGNTIYLLSGFLEILKWPDDWNESEVLAALGKSQPFHRVILAADDPFPYTEMAPGVWHCFTAFNGPVLMLETYFSKTPYRDGVDDIERIDLG